VNPERDMTIDEKFRLGYPIDRALTKAAHRALREHKLMGRPVVGWRDGQVVMIPPEEIPDYPDPDADVEAPQTNGLPKP
jgi:hypothetical protein